MGTNVYAYINNIEDLYDYDKLERLAHNHDISGIEEWLDNRSKVDKECEIHIGKRSCGWKFLFNHNHWKYYGTDKESIDRFLRSCYEIKDEYGDVITVDEFWKEFIDDFKDGMTGEDYAQYEVDLAKKWERGEIKNNWACYKTVAAAEQAQRAAKNRNWYEARYDDKGNEIDYNKLDYRFSDSTEFC